MGKYNRKFGGDYYESNPYYNPEKCGLKLIGVLNDPDASYDFSDVIVVEDNDTKAIFMAHDSGCSCPTPFEDYDGLDKMTRIKKIEQFDSFMKEVSYTHYPMHEVKKIRDKVVYRLKKMGGGS